MDYPKVSFTEEVSLMMFGFGDSPTPHPETVRLVESIVLKQMKTIVQEALKYSEGNNSLKGTEMVFLLRHNKMKMRRFVKYLYNKHLRAKLQNIKADIVDLDVSAKPKNELLDYIEYIDETGEFTNLSEIDEIKQERELRADKISQALDEKMYMQFCKARQVSFQDTKRLRVWVDPKKEIDFSPAALTVLSYFAYQTLAEIIDYVHLLRVDAKCGTDPLAHLASSTSTLFSGCFEGNENKASYIGGQSSISVNEIKEVMRRVHTPQSGRLNFGGKFPETQYLFAL